MVHSQSESHVPCIHKSWFSGRGWRQQLFRFQSLAVHWMARTSSLNCLPCRNPYQTLIHWIASPFSLKDPFFFTEKCFMAPPSQKSAPNVIQVLCLPEVLCPETFADPTSSVSMEVELLEVNEFHDLYGDGRCLLRWLKKPEAGPWLGFFWPKKFEMSSRGRESKMSETELKTSPNLKGKRKNPKPKESHEQHQRIFWTARGYYPIKKGFWGKSRQKVHPKVRQNLCRKSSLGYLFCPWKSTMFQLIWLFFWLRFDSLDPQGREVPRTHFGLFWPLWAQMTPAEK